MSKQSDVTKFMQEGDVRIVIPSHKRAADVTTTERALPKEAVVLCVPKAQEAEYREHNPDVEVDAHPDDVIGISPKRMWIAERYGDHFQCDDDQLYFTHMEHAVGEKECRLEPWAAYEVIQRTANMARDLGVFLFSLSPYPDIRTFFPGNPFRVTGFVIGGKLGWLRPKESKLSIPPQIVAKDDYYLSAMNAHLHRMALIDFRYGSKFKKDFVSPGGQAGVRTSESEKRDNELLIRHFGDDIFREKHRTTLSKGKSGHGNQITMQLPF